MTDGATGRQSDSPVAPTKAEAARVVVLSAPTAAGKSTVVRRLRDRLPHLFVSVPATTRPARPGETDGVDYRFVDDATFDAMVADGELLEWATVHGSDRYGTPRGPVLAAVRSGRTVVLEIDVQGARQVRDTWPGARFVFLTAPSWDELARRLASRGTEDPAQQERRLRTARDELEARTEFDHIVVNRDVEQAVDDLVDFIGLQPDCDPT